MPNPLFSDVVVNGERISRELIAAEAQNHNAPADKPGIAWRKAADALALRTLLLQEARKQGLTPTAERFGKNRIESSDEALVRTFLEKNVAVKEPSEAQVRAEWLRDPKKFRAPPIWEASHILYGCKFGEIASEQFALNQAEQTTATLRDNPARFSSIAKTSSDCASGKEGGFLGQLTSAHTAPEFTKALRGLAVGSITEAPVRTKFGYHIIRLDAAIEGSVLPFEAVKNKIRTAMEKVAWSLAAAKLVDQILSTANISGADIGSKGRRDTQLAMGSAG